MVASSMVNLEKELAYWKVLAELNSMMDKSKKGNSQIVKWMDMLESYSQQVIISSDILKIIRNKGRVKK